SRPCNKTRKTAKIPLVCCDGWRRDGDRVGAGAVVRISRNGIGQGRAGPDAPLKFAFSAKVRIGFDLGEFVRDSADSGTYTEVFAYSVPKSRCSYSQRLSHYVHNNVA